MSGATIRLDWPPLTITVEQAATLLGISRRSAYAAAARGELPTIRIGRRLVVPTYRLLHLLGLPADLGLYRWDGVRGVADHRGVEVSRAGRAPRGGIEQGRER